jgi:uncharacterized protein YlzI (FlbEa/FlbD family)
MKLIKLTRQPYGETIMINPQFVTAIEEISDGTIINILAGTSHGTSYKVKESIEKVSKLINNGGWNMTYTYDNAQTNARQTQDNAL